MKYRLTESAASSSFSCAPKTLQNRKIKMTTTILRGAMRFRVGMAAMK